MNGNARKLFRPLAALVAIMSLMFSGAAFADNINDDITDGVTSALQLTAGDTNSKGTAQVKIVSTNGDSNNQCNIDNATQSVTIKFVTPAGVSAIVLDGATTIAGEMKFTTCDAFQRVEFSASAAATLGNHNVTASVVQNSTIGSYNNNVLIPIQVNAAPASPPPPPPVNTAPSVSVTGVADGASYEFGEVPTAGCSVVDAEDTNESANPQVSSVTGPLSTYGLGSQTVSCSYTDGGLLSDSDSVTYSIVDTGLPTITNLGPTATANGSNGWYVSAVTNEFRASDSGAGFLSPLTNPHDFTKDSGTAEGPAVEVASGPVSDVAGNTATSINSAEFKIDLSNPTNIAFVGGPAAGSTHYFGFVPAAPTCTADDAISGLASCIVTNHSTAVGNHTMTATATDNAGRTATATRSYTVSSWGLKGFYQPVDMNGVVNTVKSGSTVPLKFEIFAGTTELTNTSFVTTLAKQVTCNGGVEDTIEVVATGGTSLRYDTANGGQFIFNWQTPKLPGRCYDVTVTTQDGSSITAKFSLK